MHAGIRNVREDVNFDLLFFPVLFLSDTFLWLFICVAWLGIYCMVFGICATPLVTFG